VSKKILVTGGAGFIGSYLVGSLLVRGNEVAVLDNLSSGGLENLSKRLNKRNFRFVKGDLLRPYDVEDDLDDCEVVFHLAANPEVKVGSVKPSVHFRQNVLATYNLLEMLRTCCWMFQRLRGLDGNRGITALRLCG